VHYPAVHLLSLYREHGGVPGTTPRAERLCERLVTLPLYPAMTASDQTMSSSPCGGFMRGLRRAVTS
jgi:dTDP-4-amino-4,6-dideoxygalactose transaminase